MTTETTAVAAPTARKEDLINALVAAFEAQELNLTKKMANTILETTLRTVVTTAQEVGAVRTSIGTFRVVAVAERNGINPKTGAKLVIPARDALKFKAAANILDGVVVTEEVAAVAE